ncbi:hypothetical protein JCM16106_07680 [Hydrogenophilus islandicus]
MAPSLTRRLALTLIVSGLLAASMTSWAQPMRAEPPAQGPGMMQMGHPESRMAQDPEAWRARMAERQDSRLNRLETLLQLTDAQKPAWQKFRTEWKALHDERFATMSAKREAIKETDSVVARLKLREEHLAQMIEETRKERALIEAFYAQLTEAQKKVFDREFLPNPREHRRPMERQPMHR